MMQLRPLADRLVAQPRRISTTMVQENIARLARAQAALEDHPMCARAELRDEGLLVIFPEGHFPQGVLVRRRESKIAMIAKALELMEKAWCESYPVPIAPRTFSFEGANNAV